MAKSKVLRIYLDEISRQRAKAGEFNIINRIQAVFERHGFRVDYCRDSEEERGKSADRRGYSLFMMHDPFHPRALSMRKAYYYPFWRVERTHMRWKFEIAQSEFRPENTDLVEATRFCNIWRRKLFANAEPGAAGDGSVYIPLQGHLLERRSIQSASPLNMIEAVLSHDPGRPVTLALHPTQTYLPEETDALKALIDRHPRLRLSGEPAETLLARCDYVVTQNSSVAFSGMFLHKPAALFARIDFHHICANAHDLGIEQAISTASVLAPDFDRYIYWFLKGTALNGGSPDVDRQIEQMFRKRGWDL